MNERLASNEYGSSGLHSHQASFNRNTSGFNKDSSALYPSYMPGQTKEHMLDSKCNTKESDSGFLSGMSLQEEGLDSESSLVADKIHHSTTSYSDSGLDLNVSSQDLKPKSTQITPVSTLQQTQAKDHFRQISVSDLLRADEDGDTALHLAVLQGFIEVVFSLVRVISDPSLLDIPNNKHQTPLHLAVLTNQAPLVRRLVVGGSSVLSRDCHGNTPLHLACREGFFECARALCIPIAQEERQAALLHDAIPPQPLPQDFESRNYDGQMPLHLAAMNGHGQITKLLCCFGANVNAIVSRSKIHLSQFTRGKNRKELSRIILPFCCCHLIPNFSYNFIDLL